MQREAQSESSDTELIRRWLEGDAEAFQRLMEGYGASVFRYARAIVRDEDTAQDVLQQTFVIAMKSLEQFRGASSLQTWLLTIARREAIHFIRKERRKEHLLEENSLIDLGLNAGWGSDDPELSVASNERKQILHEALQALPEHYREVIVLRDIEEMSGDEAAAILGVGLAAQKSLLHRARLHLMANLRRGGLDE